MSVDIRHFTLIGGPFHGTVARGVDALWPFVTAPSNGMVDGFYTRRTLDREVHFVHHTISDAVAKILKKAGG